MNSDFVPYINYVMYDSYATNLDIQHLCGFTSILLIKCKIVNENFFQ